MENKFVLALDNASKVFANTKDMKEKERARVRIEKIRKKALKFIKKKAEAHLHFTPETRIYGFYGVKEMYVRNGKLRMVHINTKAWRMDTFEYCDIADEINNLTK